MMNSCRPIVPLAALLVMGIAGCPSDYDVKDIPKDTDDGVGDTGDEAGDESSESGDECEDEFVDVDCGEGATCDQAVELSQVVMDCYWDADAGDWAEHTPPEIEAQCEHDQPCTVTIGYAQPLDLVDSCTGCINLCDRDPEACCHWNMPSEYGNPLGDYWDAVYDPFAAQIHADCDTNGVFDVSLDFCPFDTRSEPIPTISDCSVGAALAPSNGDDLVLLVDPKASYLGMSHDGASLNASVMGSSTAKLGPLELTSGLFWVEDTNFGGLAIENWAFSFSTPIKARTSAGQFRVPIQQVGQADVLGEGLVEGDPWAVQVRLAKPALGTLDLQRDTWSLRYEQVAPGGGIVLQLQGPVQRVGD